MYNRKSLKNLTDLTVADIYVMRSIGRCVLQHEMLTQPSWWGFSGPSVVVFLLRSVSRLQWEIYMKSSWCAMTEYNAYNAARAIHDGTFAPSAAGNGGAFGSLPIKSVQYTSKGTSPRCSETDKWTRLSQQSWQWWLWIRYSDDPRGDLLVPE